MRTSCLIVLGFLLSPVVAPAQPTPPAAADAWTIDSNHSSANFAVRHMLVSTVRGKLGKMTGTIQWDGKDVRSIQADVTIDATGIDTGVENRDRDLRGDSFFNTAQYPTITFKSKRVVAGQAGSFKLVGDLRIRDTTKEITLDVEGPSPPQKVGNNYRTGATATGTINRREFGLLYNKMLETGGAVVADEVKMTIDVEATRPAASSTP